MSSQLRLSIYGAIATMATSLSLLSVFSNLHWFFPVEIGVALVAGSCALVRRSALPSVFEPILASLAVLIWITLLYARSDAWIGLIPTGSSFSQLAQVARDGFTEIRQLPTPAPPHEGLVMLTVVGVAAIALVVDLMTVTLRRAALAGLPLLALFTVCAATGHHGVGIIAFITSAVGYLWLLYADNREKVARWGAAVGSGSRARPASAWSTDLATAPAPASLGRQVGAVAISVGVLLPLFIPGLHTGINKHGGIGGSGEGGGSVQTFDPLVRVGADLTSQADEPVLSYKTSAVAPTYLRLTSLDVYDGTSFTEGSLSAPSTATASQVLPVDPPLGTPVTTSITISPSFEAHWLPVQTTALGVDVGSQWRYDPVTATIFSATTDTAGLKYTTRSVPNEPTASQLEHAGRPAENLGADLALPRIDPAVVALTHRVTRNATSRYQAAIAIERFFTTGNRFTYTTNIPADTKPDALAHFLLQSRRGFCQQYAAAMTVMARLSGIPARVAVGFTRGKRSSDDTWHVTTHDAHAWPELWFQGYGWLPFEPTPRGDGQAVTPSYAQGPGGGGKNANAGSDTQKIGGGKKGATSKTGAHIPDQPTGKLGVVRRHHHRAADVALTALWIILIALCALLLVPGIARLVLRRRRWRRISHPDLAAAAAWAELRDTAVDFGLPWSDDRSPRQIATGLLAELNPAPDVREATTRLSRAEERSRYAPTPAGDRDLRAAVLAVRGAAAAHATRRLRLSARLLPRSTVGRGRRFSARGYAAVEQGLRLVSPLRGALWLGNRIAVARRAG